MAKFSPRDARDAQPPSKLHRKALNPTPTKTQEPDQLRRSNNHRPRPRGDDSGCVGGGVDKSGDRRGDGRPNRGLEHPSGPPRERGRRRGLRRVGDSRPGRGDRGDRLEKDAGLRAPGTRRGESWQADRNKVWSLRTSGEVVSTTRGRSTVSYLFGVGAGGGVAGAAGSKTTVGSCVGVVVRGAAMLMGETGGIPIRASSRAPRVVQRAGLPGMEAELPEELLPNLGAGLPVSRT